MAVTTLKLTTLLASAAALVAALPAAQKAAGLNQTTSAPTATATTSKPTAAATPAPASSYPTRFGVNLTGIVSWSNERAFMNLMAGTAWQSLGNGWAVYDKVDRNGSPLGLNGDTVASGMITPPKARTQDVAIRCTYEGSGTVNAFPWRNVSRSDHEIRFTWNKGEQVLFMVQASNDSDPIRNIDCREASADPKALFDPDFLAAIRPYNTVRFLEWQKTNDNTGGDWSKRTLPTSMSQRGPDGVAVEHLVALANAAHVNPYFTMPLNADATYTENFARYVHDHLDKSLVAYVEISNEVWNWGFNAAQQALAKQRELKLDSDDNRGRMNYYASKIIDNMTVWERVYGADRARLVRIAAGQAVWPDLLQLAMEYKDTANHVDAIAMAPYFGFDLFNNVNFDTNNLDTVFTKVSAAVDDSIGYMKADKALAKRWGKRLICYEAGQHMGWDPTVIRKMNTDPRMGDAYRKYMQAWDANAGDLMTMFTSVSAMSNYAWGLAEYSGQPMSETPKRKAVLDMIAAIGSR